MKDKDKSIHLIQNLADHYAAKHLGKGNPEAIAIRFRNRMAQINGLEDEARDLMADLEDLERRVGGDLSNRCTISSTQLECLRLAFAT